MNPIGVNPDYRVENELVRPTDLTQTSVVRLKRGSFYSTGISIRRVSDNSVYPHATPHRIDVEATEQSKGIVYKYLGFSEELTEDLYVTYYYFDASEIDAKAEAQDVLNKLQEEEGGIDYNYIQDKPHAVSTAEHEHSANTLNGLESLGYAFSKLVEESNRGLDSLISTILADKQSKQDSRLNTVDKTIVGAINELLAIADGIDMSAVQNSADDNLNTVDNTLAGAINEMKDRLTALDNLLNYGFKSGWIINYNKNLNTNEKISRVWVTNEQVAVEAAYADGDTRKILLPGDMLFLDGPTGNFYHQPAPWRANWLSDKDYQADTNDANSSVLNTVNLILSAWEQLFTQDLDETHLGDLSDTTDFSGVTSLSTGYYVAVKDGVSFTHGDPSVEVTLNAGHRVIATTGSDVYTVDATVTTQLQRQISVHLPDINEVDVLKALKVLRASSNDVNVSFGQELTYRGHLTDGVYQSNTFTDSGVWTVAGDNVVVNVMESGEEKSYTLTNGDVVYRNGGTGKVSISRIGTLLSNKLSNTDVELETDEQSVIAALLEVGEAIPSYNENVFFVSDMSQGYNGSEYYVNLPTTPVEGHIYVRDDPTIRVQWVNSSGTNQANTAGDYRIFRRADVATGENGEYNYTNFAITDNSDLEGYVNILPQFDSSFAGADKSIVGEINRIHGNLAGRNELATGDVFKSPSGYASTGGVLGEGYALPCDGKLYNIADYPELGTLLGEESYIPYEDLYAGENLPGKGKFRTPYVRPKFDPLDVYYGSIYTEQTQDQPGVYRLGTNPDTLGFNGACLISDNNRWYISLEGVYSGNYTNYEDISIYDRVEGGHVRIAATGSGTLRPQHILPTPDPNKFYVLYSVDGSAAGGRLGLLDLTNFDVTSPANTFTFTFNLVTGLHRIGTIIVDRDKPTILYQMFTSDPNSTTMQEEDTTLDTVLNRIDVETGVVTQMPNFPTGNVRIYAADPIIHNDEIYFLHSTITDVVYAYNIKTNTTRTITMDVSAINPAYTWRISSVRYMPTRGIFTISVIPGNAWDYFNGSGRAEANELQYFSADGAYITSKYLGFGTARHTLVRWAISDIDESMITINFYEYHSDPTHQYAYWMRVTQPALSIQTYIKT